MKKLGKILIGTSLAITLVLSGCANKSTTSEEKTVIRIGTGGGGSDYKFQQEIAADYMKEHKNVEIKVETVPADYEIKLLTQFAGGDAPDIFQIGDGDVSWFQSKGVLADLTKYMKGKEGLNMDDFYIPVMDVGKIDGKYYTMPIDYSTYAVFYNKDMFDKAGIPYPTDDWTWDDFQTIAKKLTKKDGNNYTQWGAKLPDVNDSRTLLPLLYSYGGNVISEDGKKVEGYMNSMGTKEAFKVYNKMVNIDHISPSKADLATLNGDPFLSKKVAMNVTGIWPTEDYINGKMNFGVVKMPKGPAGQYSSIAYTGYGINSKSQNKEEAWKYLKYLSTTVQEKLAKDALTAYKPVAESNGQTTDPYKKVFINSIDNIKMFPERLNFNFGKTAGEEYTNIIQDVLNATNGKADINSLLDEAAKKGQEEMENPN